jgi:hypothetical protein
MFVYELIEKLQNLPDHALVYVWDGLNADSMKTMFSVNLDSEGDVILE